MGRILLLNDIYPFELPEPPSDEKLIWNHDKPIEEQYWQRPPIPVDFAQWNMARQQKWIEEETIRCFFDGVHIYIKGEVVWLPPAYYFTLRWWLTKDGYFEFRRAQLLEEYFWTFCDADPKCIGTVQFKKRRDGLTTRRMARMIWRALQTRNGWFGMQSKTGPDAKKVCWNVLMRGFKRLPKFFYPELSGSTDPKTMLELKKPARRITNSNRAAIFEGSVFQEDEDDTDLNTSIDYRDTVADAYDGQQTDEICLDEFAKWEKASALDAIYTYIKSCSIDGRKIGMINAFSSPSEQNGKAHDNAKKIWEAADYSKRNESDSFLLYRWFTSSLDSWAPAIDKYGDCDQDLARKKILSDRAVAPESKQLAVVRQTAMTLDEVLDSADGTVFLNAPEIIKRKKYLQTITYKDIYKTEPKYIYGNWYWENDIPDTAVLFKPSENQQDFSWTGRFAVSKMPVKGTKNFMVGKLKKGKTVYSPDIDSEYVLGVDPYDFRRTDSKHPSNGAGVMGRCFDFLNQGGLNDECFIYNYRPKDPNVFYEDMILATVVYNAHVNSESKNAKILDYYEDRGYFNCLLPKDMTNPLKQDIKGTPTTNPIIQQICTLIEGYTNLFLNNIWHEGLCDDVLQFDPDDTKKSNLTMAFGQMLIGFTKRRRFTKKKRPPTDSLDTLGHAVKNNYC